jgi:hypothetical protein
VSRKRKRATPPAVWEPLRPTGLEDPGAAREMFAAAGLAGQMPDEWWGSTTYSVAVRRARVNGVRQPRSELLHVTVHRRDRKAIRDWRHMQAIKNDVAGPDRVAVEIYPAERNLVDSANEYHLWVLPVGVELPFGLEPGGMLLEPGEKPESLDGFDLTRVRQRPWQPGITTGPRREL